MLTCVATGNPVPSVAWLKDGSPISGNALDRNGILYINEFTTKDSGNYTCIATSVLGIAETHFSLTGTELIHSFCNCLLSWTSKILCTIKLSSRKTFAVRVQNEHLQ